MPDRGRTLRELARMARQWAEVAQAALDSRRITLEPGGLLDLAHRQLRLLDPAVDRRRARYVLHPAAWADLVAQGAHDQLAALAVGPSPAPGEPGTLFGIPVTLDPEQEGPPRLVLPSPDPGPLWHPGVISQVQRTYDRTRHAQATRPGPFLPAEWRWLLGRAVWGQLWALTRQPDDDLDPPDPEAAGARLYGIPVVVQPGADPDTLVLEPALPSSIATLPTPVRARVVETAETMGRWWGWTLPQALGVLGRLLADHHPGRAHLSRPALLAWPPEAPPDPSLDYLTVDREHDGSGRRRLVISDRGGRRLILGLPPVPGSPADAGWDCEDRGHLYVTQRPACQVCGYEPPGGPPYGWAEGDEEAMDGQGQTWAVADEASPAQVADPTSEAYLAHLDQLYDPEEDRRRLAAVDQVLADRQAWESAAAADAHTMTFSAVVSPTGSSCPTGAHPGRCCLGCDHDLDGYDCTCLED